MAYNLQQLTFALYSHGCEGGFNGLEGERRCAELGRRSSFCFILV